MDTKTFLPALRKIAQEPKTIALSSSYSMQSARWWLSILLFSAFCAISGCERRIPGPNEPIIEQQNGTVAGDRTENQDDNSGTER